jgi:hypothetical protein
VSVAIFTFGTVYIYHTYLAICPTIFQGKKKRKVFVLIIYRIRIYFHIADFYQYTVVIRISLRNITGTLQLKVWYLDFHNQSVEKDILLPRTRWNKRIVFCIGLYLETLYNLTWCFHIVDGTRICTRILANLFQVHSIETRAVFPTDRIVRQGGLRVDFVRGTSCVNPTDQWYFPHAPACDEWLSKQEQIPLYYVVSYVKQEPPPRRHPHLLSWRDLIVPIWLCTVSTF